MYTLFISDLHLDASRPAATRAFLRFLDKDAKMADALYILGDLFEVWLGDDDDSEFANRIQDALARFAEVGPPVYFIHGNRDFLIRSEFAKRTHVQLLNDPTTVMLYDYERPILLSHGDSLCTLDHDYMAFRQRARSPQWQDEILAQPIEIRRQLAADIRSKSKAMNSSKPEDIMDVTPQEVVRVMEQEGVLTMIHGHTHRPFDHNVDLHGKNGRRIVLGDWDTKAWCARATQEGITLESWDIR